MDKILQQINKTAIAFLTPQPAEEMYKLIVEEGKKITSSEYGSIFLHQNNELKRVYASDPKLYKLKPRKKGFIFQSFITHKPSIYSVEDFGDHHTVLKQLGVKNVTILPLEYKGDALGVLTLQSSRQVKLTKQELGLLNLFGSLATMAVRKTQLYDEIKQALETRDLFISLASHELRTPLTSIMGYIQLLHARLSSKNSVESKWVKELYDEGIRLTNLVKELLEINRIKQGQLHYQLEEINIGDVIETAIMRYKFITPERTIVLQKRPNLSTKVIGDSEKLLQMFTALISNADKFSSQNDPILVSISHTKQQVIITVKDTGSGIAQQDLRRVMEGFYKSGNKETEGLGVGLLLAKHIIQFHHGSIALRSKLKKGTAVEVRLPLSRI